jgi:hypothetical protein
MPKTQKKATHAKTTARRTRNRVPKSRRSRLNKLTSGGRLEQAGGFGRLEQAGGFGRLEQAGGFGRLEQAGGFGILNKLKFATGFREGIKQKIHAELADIGRGVTFTVLDKSSGTKPEDCKPISNDTKTAIIQNILNNKYMLKMYTAGRLGIKFIDATGKSKYSYSAGGATTTGDSLPASVYILIHASSNPSETPYKAPVNKAKQTNNTVTANAELLLKKIGIKGRVIKYIHSPNARTNTNLCPIPVNMNETSNQEAVKAFLTAVSRLAPAAVYINTDNHDYIYKWEGKNTDPSIHKVPLLKGTTEYKATLNNRSGPKQIAAFSLNNIFGESSQIGSVLDVPLNELHKTHTIYGLACDSMAKPGFLKSLFTKKQKQPLRVFSNNANKTLRRINSFGEVINRSPRNKTEPPYKKSTINKPVKQAPQAATLDPSVSSLIANPTDVLTELLADKSQTVTQLDLKSDNPPQEVYPLNIQVNDEVNRKIAALLNNNLEIGIFVKDTLKSDPAKMYYTGLTGGILQISPNFGKITKSLPTGNNKLSVVYGASS